MVKHRRISPFLLAVSAAVFASCIVAAGSRDVRTIRILSISDWHGQLEPIAVIVDGIRRPVGGAAALKAWLDAERGQAPNATIVTMAGDSFGATPPASAYLDDVPAVEMQNALGVDADTLGNHNFDHGIDRLRMLTRLARFPYVSANVVSPDGRFLVPPTHMRILNGVRVGIIGITNPETPQLVPIGATGAFRFLDPVATVTRHAEWLRREGADVVVVLAHVGAIGTAKDGSPIGPLADLVKAVKAVDVVIGDHTNVSVAASIGNTLVVENQSRGAEYAVIEIQYDLARKAVLAKRAVHHRPFADAIAPDTAVQAQIAAYRDKVRIVFDRQVGEVLNVIPRLGGLEPPLGRTLADALRLAYGTDIAFVNFGAIRDDLPSNYRPGDASLRRPALGFRAGPPWDVLLGDLHTILPFGNVAVTFHLTGKTLWEALEHSIANSIVAEGRLRQPDGRFLQISGFRYRAAVEGQSPRHIVHVALTNGRRVGRDDRQYSAATLDFLYDGGDAYTMLKNDTGVTRLPVIETLRDFLPKLLLATEDAAPRIEFVGE